MSVDCIGVIQLRKSSQLKDVKDACADRAYSTDST